MTPGSDFLAIQKIIKKSSPQKSTIFRFWAHFGAPLASFWAILESQKAPKGDIFTYFFRCIFGPGFWSIFSLKNEKSKKWKSVFRPVNIDRSWGSPCPKKCKDVSKKATKKTTIFQSKIDEKSMKKWVAAPFSAKIEKIAVLGAQFPSKIDFLVDFGSPGGPKNRPNWVGHIEGTPSWSQLGTILGPRSHFYRFWLPF